MTAFSLRTICWKYMTSEKSEMLPHNEIQSMLRVRVSF